MFDLGFFGEVYVVADFAIGGATDVGFFISELVVSEQIVSFNVQLRLVPRLSADVRSFFSSRCV